MIIISNRCKGYNCVGYQERYRRELIWFHQMKGLKVEIVKDRRVQGGVVCVRYELRVEQG